MENAGSWWKTALWRGGVSEKISPEDRGDGARLACKAVVSGDVTIRVPVESPFSHLAEKKHVSLSEPVAGDETGLVAYYRFDQADGAIAYDWSGNDSHGTLTNMDPDTDWVAFSAFNTWIGSDSSNWADARNWSLGIAPSATDNVDLYEWLLGYTTSVAGTPTVNSLLVATSASPLLDSAITVGGSLILEGDMDLNGQTVTLGPDAFLIEEEGLFYGTGGAITTTRTLSNIDEDVAGLGAEITTIANLGETTITRRHATSSVNGDGINRSTRLHLSTTRVWMPPWCSTIRTSS